MRHSYKQHLWLKPFVATLFFLLAIGVTNAKAEPVENKSTVPGLMTAIKNYVPPSDKVLEQVLKAYSCVIVQPIDLDESKIHIPAGFDVRLEVTKNGKIEHQIQLSAGTTAFRIDSAKPRSFSVNDKSFSLASTKQNVPMTHRATEDGIRHPRPFIAF